MYMSCICYHLSIIVFSWQGDHPGCSGTHSRAGSLLPLGASAAEARIFMDHIWGIYMVYD